MGYTIAFGTVKGVRHNKKVENHYSSRGLFNYY